MSENGVTPEAQTGNDTTSSASNVAKDISGNKIEIDQSVDHSDRSVNIIGVDPSEFGGEDALRDRFWHPPREVTAALFESYGAKEVSDRARKVLHDSDEVEQLLELWAKHRIVILTGQDKLGKGQTAFLLAAGLLERGEPISQVLWMAQPEPGLRIDPQKIADNEDQFGRRILIIKDAFSLKNAAMARYVSRLDSSKVRRLSRSLQDNDIFLLLTSDTRELLSSEAALKSHGLLARLKLPEKELLRRCLRRELETRFPEGERSEELQRAIDGVLEDSEHIVNELQTMPHVVTFVRDYLEMVAADDVELEEALRQSRDVKGWLLKQLASDFDTWCGALALILCYPVRSSGSLTWYDFHQVRTVVTLFMKRELRVVLRNRSPGEMLGDGDLVRSLRAETQKLVAGPDLIRFRDSADATRLWGILLNHCRGLLSAMTPWLSGMARLDHPVHLVAARALGRIGEMAPERITMKMIAELAGEGTEGDCLLGHLLQGVLGSEDAGYRTACLNHLQRLTMESSPNRSMAAIRSLRYLGEIDLPLAMKQLEVVVVRRFAPRLKGFDKLEGELRQAGREFAETWTQGVATRLSEKDHKVLLSLLTQHILEGGSEREGAVLSAVQYAIVGLCFELDPVDVLGHISGWMARDPGQVAPLMSFLLLNSKGIANLLDRYLRTWLPIDEDGSGEAMIACNRIVVSMAYSEDSIPVMASFLGRVFRACGLFPGMVGQYFRYLFGELLKTWVESNFAQSRCYSALVGLFGALLSASDREFKEFVFELLSHDPLFAEPSSDLAGFASDAMESAF